MGRLYSIPFNGTLANAAGDTDLVEILPADDKPVKLRGFKFGQTSELGDSAEEQVRISILRLAATVTGGSGGAAVGTPAPMNLGDTAAAFAAEVNNSTVATSSGTTETLEEFSINIRAPFETWWPDFCWNVRQGSGLVIRCQSTVADDISAQWTAIVEEE